MEQDQPETAGTRAIALLTPLYDAAIVHIVAEIRDGKYHNLYTVLLYGQSKEIYTFPNIAEVEFYGSDAQFICIRQLFTNLTDPAIQSIGSHELHIGPYVIHYDLQHPIIGFRARFLERGPELETAPFDTSVWSKEFGAQLQIVGSQTLNTRTLPKILNDLAFLKHLKWSAINLTVRPERLGTLDIWYPSPIKLHVHNEAGKGIAVSVSDRLLFTAGKLVEIRARFFIDGLEVGTADLTGKGPHIITIAADEIDDELRVDGVVLDRSETHFLRRIDVGITAASTQRNLEMTKPGKRSGLIVPINTGITSRVTIGASPMHINPLRRLGHLWRSQQDQLSIAAERLYDGREIDSISKAFKDIQHFGGTIKSVTNILVVDRYSLDKNALEAIVAIAVAYPDKVTIDIATKFDDPPGAGNSTSIARVEAFKLVAKNASKRFRVHIRLHNLIGINVHDRFLMIGDRIWHVGPSFNALGEELSALIEIRNIAIKARLLDIIEPFLSNPVFDSEHS